jgi:hypothetical protein
LRPPARPAACAAALLAAALALGGCPSFSPTEALRRRSVEASHQPPPGSAAFRSLALERTPSVVVLKVDGDDIQSNMMLVTQALLAKGYSVRDYHVTLREITRAGLLARKPLDPEALQEASRLFSEAAAIAGSFEVLQLEPLRAQLSLAWIDLRAGKTLWSAQASYAGYVFGAGDRYEAALRDLVERALAPLPAAKP